MFRQMTKCFWKKALCKPQTHRDDHGFWIACSGCGRASNVTPFDSGSQNRTILELDPRKRPDKFYFECRVCEYDDIEHGGYGGPLDVFCPLCRVDNGRANELLRWPVKKGMTRAEAFFCYQSENAQMRVKSRS